MSKSWVFRANINLFNIEKAVRSLKEIHWRVNAGYREMNKGDRVYIFTTGINASIIAIGTIVSDINNFKYRNDELSFVLDKDYYLFRLPQVGVLVRIDKVLDKPISKEFLKKQTGLLNMSAVKAHQGTNFKVSEGEAILLEKLIK